MPLPLGLAPRGASRWRAEPWYFYAALTPYVAGTYPLRAWSRHRLAAAGRAPVLVLTYHRVADDETVRQVAPIQIPHGHTVLRIDHDQRRHALNS